MKVLFVCTHNRCRSILCEAIANAELGDRLEARSAGSQPAGAVHPLTLECLARHHIAIEDLRSQSWDDFADWAPDLVLTVCDSAAGESCPLWMGSSLKGHWGLEDPSKLAGDAAVVGAAFDATVATVRARLEALAATTELSSEARKTALKALGVQLKS